MCTRGVWCVCHSKGHGVHLTSHCSLEEYKTGTVRCKNVNKYIALC